MTPTEFVEELRKMHEPYVPETVEVSMYGEEFREPTVEEKAELLSMWCDGCRMPAANCQVAVLLERVDSHGS